MARIFQTLSARTYKRTRKQTIQPPKTYKRTRIQSTAYLGTQSQLTGNTRPRVGHIYP